MSTNNAYLIGGRGASGRRKKLWLLICVGIAMLLGVGQVFVAYADPGDLDPTFDLDGKVTTNFTGYPDEANAIAIQADGKIVGSATATPTSCPIQFADIPPGNPFQAYARCLACRGIVSGYPCGGPGEPCNTNNDPYFRPGNPVTRGQVSKMVSLAAGFNDPVMGQTFEDVPTNHSFYAHIEEMALRGVITGYPCGVLIGDPCVPPENRSYFHPGAPASRAQLTKIVANSAGFQEPVVGQKFEDVPPTAVFYPYVERIASRSIIGGYPCGGVGEPCVPPDNRPYFRPQNNVTRAQTAKVVANTFFPGCNTPGRPAAPPAEYRRPR